MDSEIKERWVAKLRSGGYTQGTGKLNSDGKYCCLGVLCEIAVEDGIVIKTDAVTDTGTGRYISKVDTSDYEVSVLPFAVKNWAGLPDTNPEVEFFNADGFPEDMTLAELNDSGKTFEEIANLIEESL